MARNRFMSPPLDSDQAELVLRLWRTRAFDTYDIARMVGGGEDAVCRTIQAARDVARELAGAE